MAKTVNPNSKVHAFEPHPMFYEMLVKNITLNNFDIIPHKDAISNGDNMVTIDNYAGINEKGSIRQTSRIEKSDYYNYLLCTREIANKIGLTKKG